MKMYILVKNTVPDKFVPLITAHASLACYLKFQENTDMITWVNGIFKKVVCLVNESEFESFKNEDNCIVMTESALNNMEVCLAFCPRSNFSKKFKFLRLWSPQQNEKPKRVKLEQPILYPDWDDLINCCKTISMADKSQLEWALDSVDDAVNLKSLCQYFYINFRRKKDNFLDQIIEEVNNLGNNKE